MKDKKTTYTNVQELTDCLLKLERDLQSHADNQIYYDWKSETQEVLSKIISKAKGIIEELTNE